MTSTETWPNLIDLSKLQLTTAEIGKAIALQGENIIRWRDYKGRLLVSVSGMGGRFVGYGQLPSCIRLLMESIAKCGEWEVWWQLRHKIENALAKCRLNPEGKAQLEQALLEQQKRLQERAEAEARAKFFMELIEECGEQQALTQVARQFYKQRSHFEQYPDLSQQIIEAGKQRREYLQNLEQQQQQKGTAAPARGDRHDWNQAGLECLEREEYDEALLCYDIALKLQPEFPEAWNNLGCALYHLQQYRDAIVCYERALQIQPNFELARENRDLVVRKMRSPAVG